MGRELNDKQKRFAQEYMIDQNATQAAIRAGYSAHTAGIQGFKLLKNAKIRDFVDKGNQSAAERLGLTHEYVLQGLMDVRDLGLKGGELPVVNKALDLLGKHLKLFDAKEPIDLNVNFNINTGVPERAAYSPTGEEEDDE